MTELTNLERKTILRIAQRHNCDRDGDVLAFLVREDQGLVRVVERTLTSGEENKNE